MDVEGFRSWLDAYFAAWVSNDPDDVAALFSEDASYWTGPFVEPWVGRDEIVRRWTGGGVQDRLESSWDVLAFDRDVGVAHWFVRFMEADAWVELDGVLVLTFEEDGRCREHREWYSSRELPSA